MRHNYFHRRHFHEIADKDADKHTLIEGRNVTFANHIQYDFSVFRYDIRKEAEYSVKLIVSESRARSGDTFVPIFEKVIA